jgi:hypothetical protein
MIESAETGRSPELAEIVVGLDSDYLTAEMRELIITDASNSDVTETGIHTWCC